MSIDSKRVSLHIPRNELDGINRIFHVVSTMVTIHMLTCVPDYKTLPRCTKYNHY